MGKCRGTIQLEDAAHTAALEHAYWSGTRHITVGQLARVGRNLCLRAGAV